MVNISNIDVRTIPYFKDKTDKEISAAAAVEQPSHAQMVKVVTGFIDDLINLEVKRLEKDAGDNSNTEAQEKAQQSLIKYHKNSPATLVQEVADDLARHVFTVKELLVQDGSALKKKTDGSTQFLHQAEPTLNDSVNNLAEQAINLVNAKLSDYGINIDNSQANKLQKEIIQQLKKPPEPKSAADTTASAASTAATADTAVPTATTNPATTTSTSPENLIISLINFLKEKQSELTKGLLESKLIATFLNQQTDEKTGQKSGMILLRESNQKIKDEIANSNQDQIHSALKNFDANLAENTKFIETHLGKNSFPNAFTKLTDDKKIQVGILLKNLETTVDQNTMVDLTGKITGQLGKTAKQNLETELNSLINNSENKTEELPDPFAANHLSKANERLKEYNTALGNIKKENLPAQKEIEKKQAATTEFLENIKKDLNNETLSIEDVKVIQKSLELTEEQRKSGKASPAIDNIFGNFINSMKEKAKEQGIEITEEGLKQFAGSAVVLAIGATLFCPNLIGNLAKGAFSLGTMMTQTVIPLYERHAQNNMMKALAQNKQNSH